MTQLTFMAHNLRIKLWQLSSASSSLDNSKPPRRRDFAEFFLSSSWLSLLVLRFFPIGPRPASTSPGEPISTGGSPCGGAGTTGTPFLMAIVLLLSYSMKTWATARVINQHGEATELSATKWSICQYVRQKVPYNKDIQKTAANCMTLPTMLLTHHQWAPTCHVELPSQLQHYLKSCGWCFFTLPWGRCPKGALFLGGPNMTQYAWIKMDYINSYWLYKYHLKILHQSKSIADEWHTKRSSCPHFSATSLTNPSQPSRLLQSAWM